jgi:hypothetical protein
MSSLSANFYSSERVSEARAEAPVSAARGFAYWRCPDCRHCMDLNSRASSNRCSHPNTPAGAVIDGVEWDEGGDFCPDFESAAGESP